MSDRNCLRCSAPGALWCAECFPSSGPPRERKVELEPHRYSEQAARARLERRRAVGEVLVMREIDGHWYTGRIVDQ